MATRYSTRCATNGLVFCMDAANKTCYTGAGSTMFSPVSTGISGSLINSPTWTNELGGGTFTFNGSNQYINLGTPPSLQVLVPISICGWFNQTSAGTFNTIYSQYDAFSQDRLLTLVRLDTGQFEFYTSAPSGIFQQYATGYSPSLNNWHYFAVVLSGSTASSVCSVYVDTLFFGTHNFSNMTSTPANVPLTIGTSLLGGESFPGRIPLIWVYNRALTKDEVFQNYNATKGRYGLP